MTGERAGAEPPACSADIIAQSRAARRADRRLRLHGHRPHRLPPLRRHPALLVLFVAPFFGAGLSGSSPPFDLLVPWQLAGVALALSPVVIGIVIVSRQTRGDPFGVGAVRAGTGALAFFVLLDLVVAVNGRYDMLATALATAYGRRKLNTAATSNHRRAAGFDGSAVTS